MIPTTDSNEELRADIIRLLKAVTAKDAREHLSYVSDFLDAANSRIQTIGEEPFIFSNDGNESDDYKRGFQDAIKQFDTALEKRLAHYLGKEK